MGVDIVQQLVAHEGEAHCAGGNGIGLGVQGQDVMAVGVGRSERFQNGLGAVRRAVLANDDGGPREEGGDLGHGGQASGKFVSNVAGRPD